jgi:hypothetical protein
MSTTNSSVPQPSDDAVEQVVASYVWTAVELVEAREIAWRSRCRPVFRRWLHVLSILFVIAGIVIYCNEGLMLASAFCFLFGIYFPFLRRPFTRWAAYWQFKKRPDKDLRVTWTLSRDSFRVQTERSDSNAEWSLIYKICKSSQGFLLYPNTAMFYWLPAHAFSTEQDRALAEAMMRAKVKDFADVR